MPSGWNFSAGYAPVATGEDVLPPWWRSESIWFPGQVPAGWVFPGAASNALGITVGGQTSNPVVARPISASFWGPPDPSSIPGAVTSSPVTLAAGADPSSGIPGLASIPGASMSLSPAVVLVALILLLIAVD